MVTLQILITVSRAFKISGCCGTVSEGSRILYVLDPKQRSIYHSNNHHKRSINEISKVMAARQISPDPLHTPTASKALKAFVWLGTNYLLPCLYLSSLVSYHSPHCL